MEWGMGETTLAVGPARSKATLEALERGKEAVRDEDLFRYLMRKQGCSQLHSSSVDPATGTPSALRSRLCFVRYETGAQGGTTN